MHFAVFPVSRKHCLGPEGGPKLNDWSPFGPNIDEDEPGWLDFLTSRAGGLFGETAPQKKTPPSGGAFV
jgi:hypothetical protein